MWAVYTCRRRQGCVVTTKVKEDRSTHDLVVSGVLCLWCRFVHEVMRCIIDTQHERFLECPRRDVMGKILVARFDTSDGQKNMRAEGMDIKRFTDGDISFWMNSSLNGSTPPTHAARAPLRAWNPVTTDSWLPAQRPSPPLSATSTISFAPSSEVASEA